VVIETSDKWIDFIGFIVHFFKWGSGQGLVRCSMIRIFGLIKSELLLI
jgi:hypothetical protein